MTGISSKSVPGNALACRHFEARTEVPMSTKPAPLSVLAQQRRLRDNGNDCATESEQLPLRINTAESQELAG
jgi:hypothetical protein